SLQSCNTTLGPVRSPFTDSFRCSLPPGTAEGQAARSTPDRADCAAACFGDEMLKVIDGKRYNTETAKEVLAIDNPYPRSDFKYEDTSLYLTKNGAWFLAGEGHAMSRWAHYNGNMYGPGSGIEPITPQQAQAILEQHGQTKLLEQYFS